MQPLQKKLKEQLLKASPFKNDILSPQEINQRIIRATSSQNDGSAVPTSVIQNKNPPRIVKFEQITHPSQTKMISKVGSRNSSPSKSRVHGSPDELIIRKVKINQLFKMKERSDSLTTRGQCTSKDKNRYIIQNSSKKIEQILNRTQENQKYKQNYTQDSKDSKQVWKQQLSCIQKPEEGEERAKASYMAHQEAKKLVLKQAKKRSLSPRIRPLSPQERTFYQNIRFLNEIDRPGSAGERTNYQKRQKSSNSDIDSDKLNESEDDSLRCLKNIYTHSQKHKTEYSQKKQDINSTHTLHSQQLFVDFYKGIDKQRDILEFNSKQPNALQAILLTQNDNNNMPRKLNIIKQRTDSISINYDHMKLGDQLLSQASPAIKKMQSLQVLSIQNNNLTDNGMNALLGVVPNTLKEIDISHNIISLLNIDTFLQRISLVDTQLQVIKANHCQLNDQGTDLLLTGIQYIKTTMIISLCNNNITNRSSYALEDTIKSLPKLRELYLHWNRIQGEGGTLILEACRTVRNIRVLDLSYNQIGISNNSQLFNSSFKRLCEQDTNDDKNNHSGIIHLDISHNQFNLQDQLFISKSLKYNKSIIGFHFSSGHNCFISSQGYIHQQYSQDLKQLPSLSSNNIHSTIDSCRFKGYNQQRLKQDKDEQMVVRQGDNCWICEGWYSHTFEWKRHQDNKQFYDMMYIHLEIDSYAAFQMDSNKENPGYFYLTRMVPPRCQIRYFFSLDGSTETKLAMNQDIVNNVTSININLTNKTYDLNNTSFAMDKVVNNEKNWQKRIENIKQQIQSSDQKIITDQLIVQLNQLKKKIQIEKQQQQYSLVGDILFIDKIEDKNNGINKQQVKLQMNKFNVLNTQKHNNLFTVNHTSNDINYIMNSAFTPRTPQQHQSFNNNHISSANHKEGENQQHQQQWDVSQSIFSGNNISSINRLDERETLQQSFEIDFQHCKFDQIVDNQDQLLQIKSVLKSIYAHIINTYKYLCASSISTSNFPGIQFPVFIKFCSKANILDASDLTSPDVEHCFGQCLERVKHSKKQKIKNKKNVNIIRYQFMEIILRLAEAKYILNETCDDYFQSLNNLLQQGYLDAIKLYPSCQVWRTTSLFTEQCDQCFQFYLPIIKSIYSKYQRNCEFLTIIQFKNICNDAQLYSKKLSEKDVNVIYTMSMMTVVNELETDKQYQMDLYEFIEAIARLADKIITTYLNTFIQLYSQKNKAQTQFQKQNSSIIFSDEEDKQKNLSEDDADDDYKNNELSVNSPKNNQAHAHQFSQQKQQQQQTGNKYQFLNIGLHLKIESLLYLLFQKCTTKELKDSFKFSTNSIFK